ncbi:MAG: hypothetical protein COB22_05845 [Cycloclasticus sp.]|nr:MAG: hypothetical protein COB22_05845 [Cycloclasticus sp.]
MDAIVADLIRETTSTTGSGLTITLTAEANYGRFADVGVVGTNVYYVIRTGDDTEVGIGSLQTGNTLDRDTPLVTVVSGVYDDSSPARITLAGTSTVSIAPTASALNDLLNDLSAYGKLADASSWTGEQTFKEVSETQYSLTGTVIDPANGTLQYKTLSANTTFTESLADGQAVTLLIDDGTAYTVTWPTTTWVGGSAPTLPTTGYAVIELFQINSVLYGLQSGNA